MKLRATLGYGVVVLFSLCLLFAQQAWEGFPRAFEGSRQIASVPESRTLRHIIHRVIGFQQKPYLPNH